MEANASTKIQEVEHIRPVLFGLAYRMLGSVGEAEDVVQDVAIRYLDHGKTEVRAPDQYLASMTARACIDQLRSARRRREVYFGPWLPEPLSTVAREADPDDALVREDSISMAFLVILETLSPLERAAFLLHDVFDFEYAEISELIGRSEAACRQLVSRARGHLRERRPRYDAPAVEKRRFTTRFLSAARDGDMDGLVRLLSTEAKMFCDGGGKVSAANRPVEGAERVARYFTGIFKKAPMLLASIEEVNGEPAIVLRHRRGVDSVISLDVVDGRIVRVFNQRNPEKLTHVFASPRQ